MSLLVLRIVLFLKVNLSLSLLGSGTILVPGKVVTVPILSTLLGRLKTRLGFIILTPVLIVRRLLFLEEVLAARRVVIISWALIKPNGLCSF